MIMIQRGCFILLLVILYGCTIGAPSQPPDRHISEVGEEDIKLMIDRFGPLLYLRNDEKYVMDDPEYVLDRGVSLCWGVVNDKDYDSFNIDKTQGMPTSSKTLIEDTNTVKNDIKSAQNSDKYKYWLHISDPFKGGNLSRAKALVRVLPAGDYSTELQFWFFYPFNGPGRVRIRLSSGIGDDNWLRECGRHYGDWELVSIIVSNTATELQSVYMSRHSGGETFYKWEDGTYRSASDPKKKLQIEGPGFLKSMWIAHPVVYSAISSHAHYPGAGNHYYERVFKIDYGLGTVSADLFDRTEAGRSFKAYEKTKYRIISSDMPGFKVDEPDWLAFDGRWGQYEKLVDRVKVSVIPVRLYKEVGRGPTGPKMKNEWSGALQAQ
jgi:hypothetical protein